VQTFRRHAPARAPVECVGMLQNTDMPPPPAAPASDELLLARALRDRDERAFRRVADHFFQPMLRLARVYVRTHDEAEDVVQETWLAALRGIARFRGRASIRTWLFRILRNRARTRGRRAARVIPFSQLPPSRAEHAVDPSSPPAAEPPPPTEAQRRTPEHELLTGELLVQLRAALEQLPARQREVVVLRDLEGRSAGEVRAALGLSPENQRVLLHRGRSKLRDMLRPYLADGVPVGKLSPCAA